MPSVQLLPAPVSYSAVKWKCLVGCLALGLFPAAQTMWLLRQGGCGLFMQHGSNSNSANIYCIY